MDKSTNSYKARKKKGTLETSNWSKKGKRSQTDGRSTHKSIKLEDSTGKSNRSVRRKKKKDKDQERKDPPANEVAVIPRGTENVKSLDTSDKKEKEEFGPAGVNVCRIFIDNYSSLGLHGLRKQFIDMKSVGPPDPRKTAFEKNVKKCRYKDIPCWDRSRVILKWPEGENDFIHANRVKHDFLNMDIICTQGPLENTIGDFWRMVWQEKVKSILMLCQVVEEGKIKCTPYYPVEIGQEISHFGLTIACREVDTSARDFIVTKLVITLGESEKLTVHHRNWVTWPDKSVPKSPLAPFRLLQHIKKEKNPVIIHCSAGVGRTGTLVALEALYRSLQSGILPDVRSLVLELRWQRSHSVQTEDQFLYLFYSIFQLCMCKRWVPVEDIRGITIIYKNLIVDYCKDYDTYLQLLRGSTGKSIPLEMTENLHKTNPVSGQSAASTSGGQNGECILGVNDGIANGRIKEIPSEIKTVDQVPAANITKQL